MRFRYREPQEMKDSGIDWLGLIPVAWDVKRNKHIFEYRRREINKEEDTTVLSLSTTGVKVKEDLDFGKSTESYVGHQLVYPEDIVFTPRDFDQTPILSGVSKYFGCISNLYFVLKCKDNINNYFVNYFWWGLKYKVNFFKNFSYGIRFSYNYDQFRDLLFLSPQHSEQEKIVIFLNEKTREFDTIISKKIKMIKKLEEAKKSLISEIVTGKVKPVKINEQYELIKRNDNEMKDSGIDWIGEIPKDWNVKRVKYLLIESTERSVDGLEEPLSMSQKYGLIPTRDMEYVPNQSETLVGNKVCYKGDLVFNKLKSHLGVFAVSNQKGIVSPDYAVYRSKGQINTKYLEYLFKTPLYINQFKRYATGVAAGLTRLYTSDLFNLMSILPSEEEQDKIVDVINRKTSEINTLITRTQEQIDKITKAKQILISETVTGKIEIID